MAYHTILAHARSEAEMKRVADAAKLVAGFANGSHVIGVYSVASSAIFADPNGFIDAATIDEQETRDRLRADKLREIFEIEMRSAELSHEFRAVRSQNAAPSSGVLMSAVGADIVIEGQPDADDPDTMADSSDILIYESGRPVLQVPCQRPLPASIERVAIAFNASKESVRAAYDALPLLKNTKEAYILWVDAPEFDAETINPAHELANALKHHDIPAEVKWVASNEKSASDAIRDWLDQHNIDMLIMGAYTHSRIREFFFGGVTRSLMTDMPCLTLFSR